MMIFSVLGWILLMAAAMLMIWAWSADRRMQRFRVQGRPTSDYLIIPIRWQKQLYTSEAHPLVTQAWRSVAAMSGCGILGLAMLALGSTT